MVILTLQPIYHKGKIPRYHWAPDPDWIVCVPVCSQSLTSLIYLPQLMHCAYSSL